HARRVRQDQVSLHLLELVLRYTLSRERAEAGVDAVDHLSLLQRALEREACGREALAPLGAKLHSGSVPSHGFQLGNTDWAPVQHHRAQTRVESHECKA